MIKDINEILKPGQPAADVVSALKVKSITVPSWQMLRKEYDPKLHPVMDKAKYPDIVEGGKTIPVSRVTYGLQKLAVKRMTELVTGIPVKRVYKPQDEKQKVAKMVMEKIFAANRINAVNVDRLRKLYAGCEFVTIWYGIEQKNPHMKYGVETKLKVRCATYSPMNGHELFPYFDETGDMAALSIGYRRKVGDKQIEYFDTYTDSCHVQWNTADGDWREVIREDISVIGKIPGIYVYRESPIWEDESDKVYEMEWAMSRNGNYLRENSRPVFTVYTDEVVDYGDSPDDNTGVGRDILQLPKGAKAEYAVWQQAIENLKFYVQDNRSQYFAALQLPDWNYEKMSQQALSGESRKQLFIDGQMKVKDESGILIDGFDREVNVVRQFAKVILGPEYHDSVDELPIETVITPFQITDRKEMTDTLMTANGNRPIMSQRESIEEYGYSDDVDQTLREIEEESKLDVLQPEVYE